VFQLALISAVLIAGLITAAIVLHIFDSRNGLSVDATPGYPRLKARKAFHPTSVSAPQPRSDNQTSWTATVDPSFIATVDPTRHGEPQIATANHLSSGRGFTFGR
jgi:hypothetical protein